MRQATACAHGGRGKADIRKVIGQQGIAPTYLRLAAEGAIVSSPDSQPLRLATKPIYQVAIGLGIVTKPQEVLVQSSMKHERESARRIARLR